MIEIINDNFNALSVDYYKIQENYEQLQQENKQLKEKIANIEEVVSKPLYISDVELAGYIKRIIDGNDSNE